MKTNTAFNPHLHYFYSALEQRLLAKSADLIETMKAYRHYMHDGLGEMHIFALKIIHPHPNNGTSDIITEASRGLKDYVCSNKIPNNEEETEKPEFKYVNNDVV